MGFADEMIRSGYSVSVASSKNKHYTGREVLFLTHFNAKLEFNDATWGSLASFSLRKIS